MCDALPTPEDRPDRGRIALIGCGHADRGDDAAGLRVAHLLRGRLPGHITVHEISSDGLAIIDAWRDCERAILVDAVVSGVEPGVIQRWDGRSLPSTSPIRLSSTHSLGIVEVLRLAETLDRLPPVLEVIGIEAGHFDIGSALSPPVESAISAVVEMLAGELGG